MGLLEVKRQGHLSTAETTTEERTATEFYLVRFDAPATAVAAENAAGVPGIGAGHPDDGTRKVKGKKAKCLDESPRTDWQVQVDYSNKRDEEDESEDPTAKPPEYSWSFDHATQPYFIDVEGKPTVNTAGEPFEDLLEREVANITGTVKVNVGAGYSPETLVEYRDAINEGGWTFDGVGIGDGQAKFAGGELGPVQADDAGHSWRELSITFKFRKTWDDEKEDRGFNELDSGGKLKEIVKGTPPTRVDKPFPLDGTGHAKPNPTDEPAKLTFKPYERKPFGVFSW